MFEYVVPSATVGPKLPFLVYFGHGIFEIGMKTGFVDYRVAINKKYVCNIFFSKLTE